MTQDTPEKRPGEYEQRMDSIPPAQKEVELWHGAGPVVPAFSSRKTILIVDDISVMRFRMRPQLEEAGYRVLEAEDGGQALELIRKDSRIDMVITDLTMPVMDGLEFIRKLRFELNNVQLPVIVCTARGEISMVRKAKLLGVQGFLVKPVAKPTLLAAITREFG